MLHHTRVANPATARANRATPIAASPPMQRLYEVAESVCGRLCTVLIRGETGSGKEVIARHIHARGPRADKPFVAVDCTTLKDSLFESQLFGHRRGAFTGADVATLGFIRSADGGTLFLDEIAELGLPIQAKLLRCLEERAVVPLGDTAPIPVDVRILTATHRDLQAMVRRGAFREDLYFRLNVVQLVVPPLRERKSDVALLAEHFFGHFAALYGEPAKSLAADAEHALEQYAWPGNVRELANAIEQVHILAPDAVVTLADLPEAIRLTVARDNPLGLQGNDIPTLEYSEQRLITRALDASGGNQTQAAQILQIDRHRLHRKMRRYGLQFSLTSNR